ncbi:Pre-rRNA-processing protein TSR2-domain-containing protein [Zychaea mexicana]|uniref:Pre-rRNA-processing protein TSR2-domain-containing protein n=1 Tax=Zychaea mexicana TaxID=64656 RepID=UPI0022FF0A59|nr:Pre-rRNA-processing protein TSR2-domain-containing protein [Zychaea mexicana]KAI9491469.1 Pre-rRNA-processing protein TSR2-domain-containing protein [Zychaea mexicana]
MAEHPNKVAFEQGVEYILKSWTALNLAVEQDWGGVESAEKRDWLIGVIVDYFGSNGKKLDVEDIETILDQIMTDEFQTILEDDSSYLVAKHLVEVYHQCIRGNFTEVERLKEKYQSRQPATASRQQQNNDEDDNDNDNGPPRPSKPEPEIDDDGFETVSYKRR